MSLRIKKTGIPPIKIISALVGIVWLSCCHKEPINVEPKHHLLKNTTSEKVRLPIKEINYNTDTNNEKNINLFVPDGHHILDSIGGYGDLNGDRLLDRVLVVQKKSDINSPRGILVVLQKPNDQWILLGQDWYLDEDPNNIGKYEIENININSNDNTLNIERYALGVRGNIHSTYQMRNNHLILWYIETYAGGAGQSTSWECNMLDGDYTEETTYTLKLPEEVTVTNYHLKPDIIKFGECNPEMIASEAYKATHKNIE